MSEQILICKVCVKPMYQKFIRDEHGDIPISETGVNELEWRCLECGSTTSGVTLLEIYAQVKTNRQDIIDMKARLDVLEGA